MTIVTSGSATAGETYTLECSLRGTSDPIIFQWLGAPEGISLITSNTIKQMNSTLQFKPINASHEGLYTCQAVVGSTILETQIEISVTGKSYSK